MCRNGVVLVGDRKITLSDGTLIGYEDKIFRRPPSDIIVWGSAGEKGLYDSFNNRVTQYFESHHIKEISRAGFLIILEEIFEKMTKISKEYEHNLRDGNLQVLIASRWEASATLHFIGWHGASTQMMKYYVIGHGEPYGSIFLKKLWNEKMDMKQVAELAYFIIKYIQEEDLDNSVGVSNVPPNDKPQVWFIPHNPRDVKEENVIRPANEQELQTMEIKSKAMLDKLQVGFSDLGTFI